ncbi:MAG: hypothetical protein MUF58_02785 [Arcicella sp.]|jgi:hypothetical protein|nr:hypothetical protein [Arcicella sp.]
MKQKLLYIIFSFVVITTCSSFGFLESSTIMHGRENKKIKADSVKLASNSYRIPAENRTSILKKEENKPSHHLTKSVIQQVVHFVKNTIEVVAFVFLNILKVVFMAILSFLFN